MIRMDYRFGVLALAFAFGCATPPDVVPLVVTRSLPLEAKGGLGVGGLSPAAEDRPTLDSQVRIEGHVRLWNVDCDALADLITPGIPGALARVLPPESVERLVTTLDAATESADRSVSELRLAPTGSATVEFTRQQAYLSSWSIQLGEAAIAADPNVDVAHFGARITLHSDAHAAQPGNSPTCPLSLEVEIAEPNGALRKESLRMVPGSPATIEIPLVSRLTLKASEALAADESLLIVAPNLDDLERAIVILLGATSGTP